VHLLLSNIYFRENLRENKYLLESFLDISKILLKNGGDIYVAKISAKISCHQNIFTKMVPFSHVADEFCFFVKKEKEKKIKEHLLIFTEIFFIFCIFSYAFFEKWMRSSRVLRMSDSQCQSHYCPGVRSQHPPT
jgi:hypothetical protein